MYTVRIPFLTPAATRISADEAVTEVDGVRYALTWDGYYHVLLVTGLPSEQEAMRFLVSANAAFARLLLEKGLAAEADLTAQEIKYFEDPVEAGANVGRAFGRQPFERVDAFVQGARPAVYPSDKQVIVGTGFPVTLSTTTSSIQALDTFLRGASLPSSHRIGEDRRLTVALALYGAYFSEQSSKARFLTLIMALEALTVGVPKSAQVLGLLKRWQGEVDVLKGNDQTSPEDLASLEALERELLFRREGSIRSQMRRLVQEALHASDDVDEVARDTVMLYDLRSRLVHEGVLDTRELDLATTKAREIVHRVLSERFTQLTQ